MTHPDISHQEQTWSRWLIEDREAHPFPENGVRQWRLIQRWLPQVQTQMDGKTERGLGIPTPRRIIDVGCGDGQFVKRLLPYGTVTGTDLSAEMMARNRAKYPGARFIAGDFMQLEIPGVYDVVVSCEFLTHIADQPACIAKMASLLRPGGVLMLATQNQWAMDRAEWMSPNPGYIRQYVTPSQLRRMLAPHFSILNLTTIGPFDSHLREAKYINSTKLSKLPFADAIKGALRFGHTIIARAVKK